jgi:hypothetical protein
MNAPVQTQILTILLLALILWRVYMRMRRTLGRQHLTKVRPWIIVILYPVLTALILSSAARQPQALAALAVGLAVGVGLGIYGFRLTRFEVTPEGLYYTPSAHIGIALSLLLVGRVAYRMIQVGATGLGGGPGGVPTLNPLTLLAVGPLFGYYTTYSIGLLRWRASVTGAKAPAGSA